MKKMNKNDKEVIINLRYIAVINVEVLITFNNPTKPQIASFFFCHFSCEL